MRPVTNSFKEKIRTFGRQIALEVTVGDKMYSFSQIVNAEYSFTNDLFRSVMRMFAIELDTSSEGTDRLYKVINVNESKVKDINEILVKYLTTKEVLTGLKKGAIVSIRFGVKLDTDTEYEYVDLGKFKIYEAPEEKVETATIKINLADLIVSTMITYDLNLTFPMTVKEFLRVICERFGFTLITEDFTNADMVIEEDKYIGLGYTFRDILDELSQVVAGNICIFNTEMYVKYPTETGEVLDEHDLETLSIKETFGAVNSVVLGRTPQEDNIYYPAGISSEDRTSIRFNNNQIMDKNREDYIQGIYQRVNGLRYTTFELNSWGFMYYEFGDIITLQNKKGRKFKTILTNNIANINTGLREKMYTDLPKYTETEYRYASDTDRALFNVQFVVDKQGKRILAIVETQEGQETKIAQLIISDEQIRSEVSRKVGEDEIISRINQTAEEIKIEALRIALEGLVTINGGFKIDKDGNMIANNRTVFRGINILIVSKPSAMDGKYQ